MTERLNCGILACAEKTKKKSKKEKFLLYLRINLSQQTFDILAKGMSQFTKHANQFRTVRYVLD